MPSARKHSPPNSSFRRSNAVSLSKGNEFNPFGLLNQTLLGHVFCSGCIKEWLKKREICPICKAAVGKPQRIHLFAAVAATADASANLHNASRDWDNDNSGSNGTRLGERLEATALAVECVARGNPEVLVRCQAVTGHGRI